MIVVSLSARPHSPLISTLIVLGLMTVLSFVLARMPDDTAPRAAALVTLAVFSNQLAYFFGPNSAFAAIIAILLAVTGLLSARQPGRRSRLGWFVLLAICLGELVI